MPWHYDVGAIADAKVLPRVNTAALESLQFANEHVGLDHDARRDDVGDAFRQNAGGDVVQFVNFFAAHHRVTSIGTPLISDDHIVTGSEQIDQFSFGFITPLQTDYTRSWHNSLAIQGGHRSAPTLEPTYCDRRKPRV
jgi:hypothetical protein